MSTRRPFGVRRSREEELFDLAAVDPEAHERLCALKRSHPQAYRKELARLVRQGVVRPGRRMPASHEILACLDRPLAQAYDALVRFADEGELTERIVEALLQQEQRERARPEMLAWLLTLQEDRA